jgi:hypothetical protein
VSLLEDDLLSPGHIERRGDREKWAVTLGTPVARGFAAMGRFRWYFLTAAFAVTACADRDNFRSDVLMCEQAAAHLQHCCGDERPTLHCEYEYVPAEWGCEPECDEEKETLPDLSIAASACTMRLPCDGIGARGVCGGSIDVLRDWIDGGACL